jgi:hypothetical protein
MRCASLTQKGSRCKRLCINSHGKCHIHSDDCPICLCNLASQGDVCTLRCGHSFHSECIYKWNYKDCRCPCCRSAVLTPRRVDVYHRGVFDTNDINTGGVQHYIVTRLFTKCYTNKVTFNWSAESIDVYDMLSESVIDNVDIKDFIYY